MFRSKQASSLIASFALFLTLSTGLVAQTARPARKAQSRSGAAPQAKSTEPTRQKESVLQQHLEAAQRYQSAGDAVQASREYRLFLAEALRRTAIGRSNAGDNATAYARLEQASALAPQDPQLRLDFVQAGLGAGQLARARSLAEEAVKEEPKDARARFLLARVLAAQNEDKSAAANFELAVAIEPTFEHGYALASQYLKMKELKEAAKVFAEMKQSFGDGAELLMAIGTAYSVAGYPDHGIEEFKKAIAKNPKVPGLHYSLGAAYIVGLEDGAFPQAAAEFREELKLNPDDPLALHQLGYIALAEKKFEEAETQLSRAQKLDPKNPDTALLLGQLYSETNRLPEAERELRKSIELTTDVSRNNYQVQRAHYLLGRLLMRSKRVDEAKSEMEVSDQLLKRKVSTNQGKTDSPATSSAAESRGTGDAIQWKEPAGAAKVDPAGLQKIEAFENQVGPAIADSYNNLGVLAASGGDLRSALANFEQAYKWNPNLDGLDYNFGKAAFQSGRFADAIEPLARYRRAHADDRWAIGALGVSLFATKNYAEVLRLLQPIEASIGGDAALKYAYAVSMVKAGDADKGFEWLKELAKTSPNVPFVHIALGDAYAARKDVDAAVNEYRLALAIVPDSEIYLRLAKLQSEHGDVKGAITTLEAGVRSAPNDLRLHSELAEAYRRDSRTEDADREMKILEEMKGANSTLGSVPTSK